MPDHAHDVAAGVEAEGARLAQQAYSAQLMQKLAAFAAVAGMAAGD